jgi:PFU (PLAA family ubiquitin binding)
VVYLHCYAHTQVTGSTDSGTLDGQSYDHVFPIEIEGQDGTVKNLKIGYNIGENPFTTAQGFIDKHMLPQVIDQYLLIAQTRLLRFNTVIVLLQQAVSCDRRVLISAISVVRRSMRKDTYTLVS